MWKLLIFTYQPFTHLSLSRLADQCASSPKECPPPPSPAHAVRESLFEAIAAGGGGGSGGWHGGRDAIQ